MQGTSAIGCISDTDPQPMLIRSRLGTYAICMVGIINNAKEIIEEEQNVSDDAEITTDQFIRISEIVGNCSENNTPYVLNVLRHIIPDIDAIVDDENQDEYSEPVEQTTEVSVNIKQKPFYRNGVSIDIDKLKMTMKIKHISD